MAYNALAVFRLLGRREQYVSLRNIMVTRGDNDNGHTPTFDELAPGVPICRFEFIMMSAQMVLSLGTKGFSGASGGGGDGGSMAAPCMGSFPYPSLR